MKAKKWGFIAAMLAVFVARCIGKQYGALTIKGGVVTKCDTSATGTVEIPKGIKSIGEEAFSHCNDLISITIPDSVTSIGNCAFFDCTV